MRMIVTAAAALAFAGSAFALSTDRGVKAVEAGLPPGPALIVFADPAAPGFDALKGHVLSYGDMYETRELDVIVADAGAHAALARRLGIDGQGVVAFQDGRETGRLAVTATAAEIDALVDRAIPDVFND